MSDQLQSLNQAFDRHKFVSLLNFDTHLSTGVCNLVLCLVDDVSPSSRLVLEVHEVADVTLKCFGGGITQVVGLHIRDVSDEQRDRVNYAIEDLEDSRLSFVCRSFAVHEQPFADIDNE